MHFQFLFASRAASRETFAVIKQVGSFQELVATPFAGGVNALCYARYLPGDFAEIARAFASPEPIRVLDETMLRGQALSAKGQEAVQTLLEDFRLLRELGRDPVLNLISGYPRDEDAAVVPTDVFSFHADSAPIEADTWLCTYHGSPSEGLRNEDAVRKIDVPEIRAALLKEYAGPDDEDFRAWLGDHCYDLHYAAKPGAPVYSFGVGHLWRIAVDWPGSPVPPCVHRAPATIPGEPRLLLIC
jgi:hypothetical protein